MISHLYKRKIKQVTCDNCGEGFETDGWDSAEELECCIKWLQEEI